MIRPVVGQLVAPFVVERVDAGHMKTVALLLRDPNPIHWDVEATKQLGLGDRPVNQGPLNMSYLIEAAARAAGGPERVRGFKARFVANVLAGDRVECTGAYVAVDPAERSATLELTASVDGTPVVEAEAVVFW